MKKKLGFKKLPSTCGIILCICIKIELSESDGCVSFLSVGLGKVEESKCSAFGGRDRKSLRSLRGCEK